MTRWLFILAFLSVHAWGADYYLLELNKNRFTKINRLLPNRVFGDFDKNLNQWVLRMTDERGKFPSPPEGILAGSVLDGLRIGGEAGKKYRLNLESKWVLAKEGSEEIYHTKVDSKKIIFRHRRLSSK